MIPQILTNVNELLACVEVAIAQMTLVAIIVNAQMVSNLLQINTHAKVFWTKRCYLHAVPNYLFIF